MRLLKAALLLLVAVLTALPPTAAGNDSPAGDDPATEKKENPLRVTYDQGFRLETADRRYSLTINGLLQLRYSYVGYDPMVRSNESDYSNFFLRRARLYFRGNAGSPRFTYFMHLQLEPTQGINANDLWIEYRFSDLLRLGAGRNKIGYGLEFLNSGSALGLVERSLMSGETDIDLGNATLPGPRYPGGGGARFGLNWFTNTGYPSGGMTLHRSQGVQLRGERGGKSKPTFEYQVGLWQGRGSSSLSNGGNDHLVSARVGYHPWGFIDWRVVGDMSRSDRFKLALFGSAYRDSRDLPLAFDSGGYNLAAIAHYRGWSLDAEWSTENYDFEQSDHELDRLGWRVAVGWFMLPGRLEFRGRYAEITRIKDPTYDKAFDSGLGVPEVWDGEDWTPALEAKISETTLGASYRLPGWRNKLALDVSRLERQFAADPDAVISGEPAPIARAPDQLDWRVRAMIQLVF